MYSAACFQAVNLWHQERGATSLLHSRIIYNKRLLDAGRARLAAMTPAVLYGRGVFTTLAVHGGRPFLWPEHWARLVAHADRLKINRSNFGEAETEAQLLRLIEANNVREGRARVTLLAGAGGADSFWKLKDGEGRAPETELLIMTGELRAVAEDGLALTVSPYRLNTLSPLTGVKSVNYLEHILAWEEARERDFHEAVVMNERGEVVSATVANIFWVKDGALHTPALQTGALAGTTRARILALAEELSVPVVEGVNDLAHLGDADEIFLTSASLSLAIVTTFDFHRYTVPLGSIALRLREAFRQLTLHENK